MVTKQCSQGSSSGAVPEHRVLSVSNRIKVRGAGWKTDSQTTLQDFDAAPVPALRARGCAQALLGSSPVALDSWPSRLQCKQMAARTEASLG